MKTIEGHLKPLIDECIVMQGDKTRMLYVFKTIRLEAFEEARPWEDALQNVIDDIRNEAFDVAIEAIKECKILLRYGTIKRADAVKAIEELKKEK